MKFTRKSVVLMLFIISLCVLFIYMIIFYNLIGTDRSSVPYKSEYNIRISKQSGNIIAKDFNGKIIASGTSNSDDTFVIQKAFDSTNNGIIYFDSGSYSISRPIYSANKNIVIQGYDTKFNINTGSDSPGFYFGGQLIKTVPIWSDAHKGSNVISLKDASGINVGDLITIYNDELWSPQDYPTHKTGETYTIKKVCASTLILNSNILRDYTTKLNSEVRIYRPVTVKIDGCTFIGTGAKEVVRGIKLEYCKNSKISNCYFDNNGISAIALYTCYGVDISKNVILNSNVPGYGYGILIANACTDITIKDNDIRTCRHCITSGHSDNYGENRDIYISKNILYNGMNAVIDSHASTINYEVTNNTIYCTSIQDGSQYAFDDNTMCSIFTNNKVYGAYKQYAITKSLLIPNSTKTITGNYIECNTLINDSIINLGKLNISNNTIVSKKISDVKLLCVYNLFSGSVSKKITSFFPSCLKTTLDTYLVRFFKNLFN